MLHLKKDFGLVSKVTCKAKKSLKPISSHLYYINHLLKTSSSFPSYIRSFPKIRESHRDQRNSLEDMEITVVEDHQKGTKEDIKTPLLEEDKDFPDIERTKWMQKAISQTFQTTANLANLLPTGTVLAFQLLSPIFSNGGQCELVSKIMTSTLVAICGFSCFMLSFTDSYKDKKGTICYGFATIHGFWIIDGSAMLPQELSKTYKLRFIDFAHAFMSLSVFGAVVLFDRNAVNCFFPAPSVEALEVLKALPVGVGVFCSMLFATFPTTRNGIGFPLSSK